MRTCGRINMDNPKAAHMTNILQMTTELSTDRTNVHADNKKNNARLVVYKAFTVQIELKNQLEGSPWNSGYGSDWNDHIFAELRNEAPN